jgi:DNA-binding CsgD family transcriptional regulator
MVDNRGNYDLFLRFIKTYLPAGFNGINPDDPLMVELEQMMEKNNQFIYVADIIQMKVIYTSKRSTQMIGVEPADVTPYYFMDATHLDDIQRLNLGRSKLIKMAQDIFIAGNGSALLSTDFKIRIPGGGYSHFLLQNYLFFTSVPYKTVFYLKIHTNIDWFKKIKHGYHYYIGNDMSYFRYPDEEMLQMGNVFTRREFEIIRLIESGLNTEQIAEKLFVSIFTINTHRRNILHKAKKLNLSEVIHDLKEMGLL